MRPKDEKGRIYFIETHDGAFVKIGYTTKLEVRLKQIAASLPDVRLLGQIPGTPCTEGWLHEKFKTLRSNGEWFKRSDDLLEFISKSRSRLLRPVIKEETAKWRAQVEAAREQKTTRLPFRPAEHGLLTTTQVAGRLQVHHSTVCRLLKSGRLPGFKVGFQCWGVPAEALNAYTERGKKKAKKPAGKIAKGKGMPEKAVRIARARAGGLQRAQSLSPERRLEIARNAVASRRDRQSQK